MYRFALLTPKNIVCQEKILNCNRRKMELSLEYQDMGVQAAIGTWSLMYNTHRPHSSLANQTPGAFAAKHPSKPAETLSSVGNKNKAVQ